jgi:Sec7 domain
MKDRQQSYPPPQQQPGSATKPTITTPTTATADPKDAGLDAARHICQEARVVLTSLRGGPPNVARGDLAQDLMDLRGFVQGILSTGIPPATFGGFGGGGGADGSRPFPPPPPLSPLAASGLDPPSVSVGSATATNDSIGVSTDAVADESTGRPTTPEPTTPPPPGVILEDVSEGSSAVMVEHPQRENKGTEKQHQEHPPNPPSPSRLQHPVSPTRPWAVPTSIPPNPHQDVGPFARPFLAVVMDPRAAGPHTLVALRALHRLVERQSLMTPTTNNFHGFGVALEPLTKGVLNCKFEQTDAGADEAVEMAIADLLALVVAMDRRALQTETLMDAFNTVFVTRNTFVHSPALCYHFEDVLIAIVRAVFEDLDGLKDPAGRLMLEFLVNQLLHTPLVGGDDEASREAQLAHDATRILCLRLTCWTLKCGFLDVGNDVLMEAAASASPDEERGLLQIIQDDLCLSLLLTGQAIWAYQDNPSMSPGFISLEVLSEICSTMSTLWTSVNLRKHLVPQFEAIFNGFYQRALVLLRKRENPSDSASFHANLVFDAGVEIILESLMDIMGLHDHRQTVAQGNGGCLETLFASYDCNIRHSDVAIGLVMELCRCTGSNIDEDGEVIDGSLPEMSGSEESSGSEAKSEGTDSTAATQTSTHPEPPDGQRKSDQGSPDSHSPPAESRQNLHRKVPPHLKELCAEIIIGSMKCLFKDDHPSESTKQERMDRDSIMKNVVSPAPQSLSDLDRITSSHHLRNIKSKKRLLRKAAKLFNKKSSTGIEFLVNSGIVSDPVTPRSVASFLRNGLVVGLDKRAVGCYLGEIGKAAAAGKNPKVWERDWFHKEVLEAFCSLFHFDRQSLLDGLRMFLACFRLPGEAQQIDRILQAFADSCGNLCEESSQGALKLFSDDPKRAADVAFLLSFSIIMLNTDQHNDNIREDRKMKKSDFVRNNTDYGRDITEPGRELPREYLEAIYDSIREEEIKTEGEGAEGSMTVERWKDVLRGSAEEEVHADELPSMSDAEDLSELVLEQVWMPIMSSISSLWGVLDLRGKFKGQPAGSSGMHGAQGARLGMDMAYTMLSGVRQLGRMDIFNKILNCVCQYSGLLNYSSNAADRAWAFANSVSAQSALIVAMRGVRDANGEINVEAWKLIWAMIFELRDLKMLGGGVSTRNTSILRESDADLLTEDARRDWVLKLAKRGKPFESESRKSSGGIWRALFGSVEEPIVDEWNESRPPLSDVIRTIHGKEDFVMWDELAPSDDEDGSGESEGGYASFILRTDTPISIGAQFESQLIQEDMLINQQQNRQMPVTGLERVEDTRIIQLSPRARVRRRLSRFCDFIGLVSDSRFMDNKGLCSLIEALIDLISQSKTKSVIGAPGVAEFSKPNNTEAPFPLSPASEAFAEVMICEIALKNRDRLTMLWNNYLQDHYYSRLRGMTELYVETHEDLLKNMSGSIEKCVTGLVRISSSAVKRNDIANGVLFTWTLLDTCIDEERKISILDTVDRHLAEGVWRITRCIDGSCQFSEQGWHGVLSLVGWNLRRGASLPQARVSDASSRSIGLPEDDPSLQAFRSLHFLLNVSDAKSEVPTAAGSLIQHLIVTGDRRNCLKLSLAGLDLLQVLNNLTEESAILTERTSGFDVETRYVFWKTNWLPVLDTMASSSRLSPNPNVRQHALSMLTDSFLDKRGGLIPIDVLCEALETICIPLAGQRIIEMREADVPPEYVDGLMIESELCIGLLFKPFRHHIKTIVNEVPGILEILWMPMLQILKDILKEPAMAAMGDSPASRFVKAMNELTMEHFRNVIMVLASYDVLEAEPESADDMSGKTWAAISEMGYCSQSVEEWKQAAAAGRTHVESEQ